MKTTAIATAILLSIVAPTGADAEESLEEKKYWKGQTDYLNRSLESASKKCGVEFTFTWIDKPKIRAELEKTNHSPFSMCGAPIEDVEMVCREGEDETAAVKAKIKGFTCGYSKSRKATLAKGTLAYMGNLEEANFYDWFRPWLLKNL